MTITAPDATEPVTASGVGRGLSPREILTIAGRADHQARIAEATKFAAAAEWADANPVTVDNSIPARLSYRGDEVPSHPGLSEVTASAAAEFAALLGLTTHAGTSYLADALEVRHRLPRVWAMIMTGGFQVWRARQLAAETVRLNDAAVAVIDTQAAMAGLGLGPRQLEELVRRATAQHDPGQLDPVVRSRHVDIRHDRDGVSGTATLDGCLSGLDAADLEAALRAGAAGLASDGETTDLGERRATALGNLARAALGQSCLPVEDGLGGDDPPSGSPAGSDRAAARVRDQRPTVQRELSLYVLLSAAAMTGAGSTCTCSCGGRAGGVELAEVPALGTWVTAEVVRQWCGLPGVTIKVTPVIDTAAVIASEGYRPSRAQRAQVALRDRTCVFPWCSRPAHPKPRGSGDHDRHDLDHITPWSSDGDTITNNLAVLCRRHHRLKTFTGWRYRMLGPDGNYLWTSPLGRRYLRTRHGTVSLEEDAWGPAPDDSVSSLDTLTALAARPPRHSVPGDGVLPTDSAPRATPPDPDPPTDPDPPPF